MSGWFRRNSVVVAVLIAGLLVAGAVVYAATALGGRQDRGGTVDASVAAESTGMSRGEFVAEADAVCADIGRQVGALPDAETFEEISRQANQIAEYYREGVAELRALDAPEDQVQTVDEWLDLLEESVGALQRQASAAFSQDLEAFQEAGRDVSDVTGMALTKARTLGLNTCANSAATNES